MSRLNCLSSPTWTMLASATWRGSPLSAWDFVKKYWICTPNNCLVACKSESALRELSRTILTLQVAAFAAHPMSCYWYVDSTCNYFITSHHRVLVRSLTQHVEFCFLLCESRTSQQQGMYLSAVGFPSSRPQTLFCFVEAGRQSGLYSQTGPQVVYNMRLALT